LLLLTPTKEQTVREFNINFDYEPDSKVAGIGFYFEHELMELVIQADGACDFITLEEFLSTLTEAYRPYMFTMEVMESLARQLFTVVAAQNRDYIYKTLADFILIIETEAESHFGFETILRANELKINDELKELASGNKPLPDPSENNLGGKY